jgi:drug/metabolite transporter (DMT)-like permease
MIWLAILVTVIAAVIGSFGALFLKRVSSRMGEGLFSLLKVPDFYFGGVMYVTSVLIFVWALRFAELSMLYSITALSYVFIALLSQKYLHEVVSKRTWWGIFWIMVGVVLIVSGF